MSDVNIPNEEDVDLPEIEEDMNEFPENENENEIPNEMSDEMPDEIPDEISDEIEKVTESENIANLMENFDEDKNKVIIQFDDIDYIAQPEPTVSPSKVTNKPLPELVSFQDIVEIITTDNNILSNENAFVSENTKEQIRILVINERTGTKQDITLKKEPDGSLAQNSHKIIYLRKEGDEEADFDHEEFKSTFKNMLVDNNVYSEDNENENDIQTEDIVKIRIKKQEKWEQQYDIIEQKTDMYDRLIQNIPENRREAERRRINKAVDLLFDLLEDIRTEQRYKGADLTTTENKYYTEYLNNNYNLEWLIPVVIDTTQKDKNPALSVDVRDEIREQLHQKLTSFTDVNNLHFSKHHKDEDSQAEYKGDSEYQNILYNGSRRTYKDMGISVDTHEGSDIFDLDKPIEPLDRYYTTVDPNSDEYGSIEENSLKIDAKNTSTAFRMSSLNKDHLEFRKIDGPVYYNKENFLPKYRDRNAKSLDIGDNSMKLYLDPKYNAGQNITIKKGVREIPVDWCSVRYPPSQKLWIDPETFHLNGWFVDSSKVGFLTPYTFQNTTHKGNDSLFTIQSSNYQPGFNLFDLVRQNAYFNHSFSHSQNVEMQCNLQIGDAGLAIPNSHDMNSIYIYSQYPDIRKEIDGYLEKKYSSKSAYHNKDILKYLNKIILSKLLPSPEKYNFELEDVKRMNSKKGFHIPNRITNLNDFDRIAGLSGLNSSLFTNKHLKRLGIWSQIQESILVIQTNRDLSNRVFHVHNYLYNYFNNLDKSLLQRFITLKNASLEKKYISILKFLKNIFEEVDSDVIRIYMNTRDVPVRIQMNIKQDTLYLVKTLETFCSDLCNLKQGENIHYAHISNDVANNIDVIMYKIENKEDTYTITLSSVLKRVEDTYSSTQDKDFLIHLITQDYVNTYNCEILKSITLQLYMYSIDGLNDKYENDPNSNEDSKQDNYSELSEYTKKLFKFLKIEPIYKTHIHNIYDLHSYITNKVNSVKYSKFSQFLHPQDTFELLKRFHVHKKERATLQDAIDSLIIEKYNKINSENIDNINDISEPMNVLMQVRTTDMEILADRITSLIMTLQHYLKTLDFCKINNISVPIVKIYNNLEDLQSDNAKNNVPYDPAFDTRSRDFRLIENLIREYSPSGKTDEFDIEYIKRLLQTKEIENIIIRAYYYELNIEDFKSIPKEIGEDGRNIDTDNGEEGGEEGGKHDDKKKVQSIIDDFIEYYETRVIPNIYVKEGDYCAVKNAPCNIYVRSEGGTWIPAETDTNMTIKNMEIKPQILELIQKLLHFEIDPEERLYHFKEVGGYELDKVNMIKTLNYFQMTMKAPLLYYNVKYLFSEIETYRKRANIFKANDSIGEEIEKYREHLGVLIELYGSIELDFVEIEEEARKIDRSTQPKYQQIMDDMFKELECDERSGLLRLKNILDNFGVLNKSKHAYLDTGGEYLICEHWGHAIKSVNSNLPETERQFILNKMLSDFGAKSNEVDIYCKYCGFVIGQQNYSDLDGFKDGVPIVSRTKVFTKTEEDTRFLKDTLARDIDTFVMQFCRNFGIILRSEHRQELQSIVMNEISKTASLETLLDNGDLQNDLLFRIKKDSDKSVFKKDSKTGKSIFDEGYELFKQIKTWKVDVHIIKLLFSSVERRLKENKRRKKITEDIDVFGIQFGGAEGQKKLKKLKKLKKFKKPKKPKKPKNPKKPKDTDNEEKDEKGKPDSKTKRDKKVGKKDIRHVVVDKSKYSSGAELLQNATEKHIIYRFLKTCASKIGGQYSLLELYTIYTKKELIFNTLSALYVILQTAIPDYPIKNTGHERETYTQFTVSDFYNDLEVDEGVEDTNRSEKDNTQGDRNKQIISFFAQLVFNSKRVVLDSNRNIPINSILTGVVNMNVAEIYRKLAEKITNLQATPTGEILYDNKFTYRTALAESFKTEGVYLKDWDNFRPLYEPNPPTIKIKELIQNANSAISKVGTDNLIDAVRSNFTFSIILINMLNEYVSKSKKLVNMNFLYNSVGMVPVDVLKENYSYFTFPLLESNQHSHEFNILLEKGDFRNTTLSLLARMNQLEKLIQKSSVDYMVYPLSYSKPIHYNLMDYFNFQNKLTDHLNEDDKLKYYQNEIKHILLLFDLRLENENTIAGTGKQREFMYIQSNGLFNRFFNEIFSINQDEIDTNISGSDDNEAKYKFTDYEDKTVEIDIRDVPNMKKAGLFIHKWNIPYDNPMKDGCGERSEVNYMEFAEEHLRKIDTFSGKSSMHLYREIDILLKEYPNSIQSYKDLLTNMLHYINKDKVVLFDDEKTTKIPENIVLYKKESLTPTVSSIHFENFLFLFNEIKEAFSKELEQPRGINESIVIREFKESIENILQLYVSLGNSYPADLKNRIDDIWYGQSESSFYVNSNSLKYSVLENIFDYDGGSDNIQSWNRQRAKLYDISKQQNLEFTEFSFNEEQKKLEISNQIMDTLSMNKLRELNEIEIYQIPKDSYLISQIKSIKTSQSELNGSLLMHIKIQELHKEHALNVLKYIKTFLHCMSIIKNKYNVIVQKEGFELMYTEEGDDEKLQLGWNKYENTQTRINLDNEYSPLYKLLNDIKKEEPDTIKMLVITLNKLYNTDEFYVNSQEVLELLTELQFQIDEDAKIYTDYVKIFTGQQYLDLMRSTFYFYILKVIQFIKTEFYSTGRTNNIKPIGRSVFTLFTQIMRDVIFNKINDMYVLDRRTEGEIQEELDKQKAKSNEQRKKAFDRKNPSEKIIYALRRSQNLGNVFQDITESIEREKEEGMIDHAFTAGLTAEMFMSVQEDTSDNPVYAGLDPFKDGVDESEFAVPDMDGDDFDAYN
jgi:hypothetical protein